MMETVNFVDFGRRNGNCRVMDDYFVFWEITGGGNDTPVVLEAASPGIIAHVIMLEGCMKAGPKGILYPLAKGCFADFIDGTTLEIGDVSADARAYVLLLAAPYVTALLKDTPPFPPSYILKIKAWPVTAMPEETVRLFRKRAENITEIVSDSTHRFQAEMLKCALWMFMMDIANEHLRQESGRSGDAGTGRKHILYRQFIRLLLAHIRDKHAVGWYASQLCVTPQYLNRVVKDTSQRTAYDHVCTALTGAIAEQLENTEHPIAQIAADFQFPDQATLTKFFKRQTGKTPSAFRKASSRR